MSEVQFYQDPVVCVCFSFPAFSMLPGNHTQLMQILEHLTLLSAGELIPYAEVLTSNMNLLLEAGVPRGILQAVNKLWMVLNTVMPRRYQGSKHCLVSWCT